MKLYHPIVLKSALITLLLALGNAGGAQTIYSNLLVGIGGAGGAAGSSDSLGGSAGSGGTGGIGGGGGGGGSQFITVPG